MRRLVCVFAALLTGAAVRAHAEPSGVLAGTVHTSEGTPVPSLVLVVHGPDAARTVVTGPEGRYRVTGLTPGHYRLALRAAGFLFAGSPEADVSATETALDLTLAPAPVREHVVVAATRDEAVLSTVGVSATVLGARPLKSHVTLCSPGPPGPVSVRFVSPLTSEITMRVVSRRAPALSRYQMSAPYVGLGASNSL